MRDCHRCDRRGIAAWPKNAERSASERDHAFFCQIALTFLLEAAIHRPEDQSFVAHAAEEIPKSAYRGLPCSMLMPLHVGAA